jgi:HAD superfamily hydrolase (TIGR01459 family)
MNSNVYIHSNLESIIAPFKGILLDAYGVFWGGNAFGLLPGAKEAMERLVFQGKIVGILSNTTQLAAKEIQKLQKHGLILDRHFHFLMTSGEIAKSLFLRGALPFPTPQKKFWLWGSIHPHFGSHAPIFQDSPYQETSELGKADFIYISIPHIKGEDQMDREVFRQELKALLETGLPMVCPNPDHFAQEGNPPRAVVRQGSIAAIYEELGGKVFYIGKPHATAYAAAMQHFSQRSILSPADILMIGDTPETDIRGARQFGMSAALVTDTGLMAQRIARQGLEKAIQQLSVSDTPHFLIQRFAYELF